MMQAILTLYEGNYHLGVGALINSAIGSGFKGKFFVGYRDSLPPWVAGLECSGEENYTVHGCELIFFRCDPARHLTYHKPFAALNILEVYPDVDAIFYADPDVLFLEQWTYFEKWIRCGVALCLDANFPFVGTSHPWRSEWCEMIDQSDLQVVNDSTDYYNAGFIGLAREDAEILRNWVTLIEHFEQQGGDTKEMDTGNFLISVRSDQELLAAAAMTFRRVSVVGLEAMGFNGHYCILSHAIESPKPWDCNFMRQACSAIGVSRSAKYYMQHSQYPIPLYHKYEYRLKMASVRINQLITRFYSKAR
ncbi:MULTISPECIES: hypothetical protein [unclassified Lentimonas]|uniref:hypothetical protein n=1 Tax=unclassified Lentimonas TaxID=2630993 RepID=UPI0013239924|nr:MULTISPECIES: hypothetical protein [unclassified Lentimonas]CAA6678615.1 Unannotated [Lentimonas sp. CC4]CAA6685847.1 Unannotated [Lentimonas sp. CC6]CAA7076321.1 Unannotated [Lentimonas sp. CC4]CAA7171868.1 Unannotated [Lentimonas sp. CC21]CAA7181575.1 Unannotated [Lentimonas sp. CC8]